MLPGSTNPPKKPKNVVLSVGRRVLLIPVPIYEIASSHPPVYYVPPEDIRMEHLTLAEGMSFCEWKGVARYYDIETAERKELRAAWFYPDPVPAYAGLKDHVAFESCSRVNRVDNAAAVAVEE